MEKTLQFGKNEVSFKADSHTPELYHKKFSRDLYEDMSQLELAYENNREFILGATPAYVGPDDDGEPNWTNDFSKFIKDS